MLGFHMERSTLLEFVINITILRNMNLKVRQTSHEEDKPTEKINKGDRVDRDQQLGQW